MAHWKRATNVNGTQVDVNMDAVAFISQHSEHTTITFVGGESDDGKQLQITVKEKAEAIHMANPLRSM